MLLELCQSTKTVVDNIIASPIAEWSKLTVQDLCTKLEAARANDNSLSNREMLPKQELDVMSTAAVNLSFSDRPKQFTRQTADRNVRSDVCYSYRHSGSCDRPRCPFLHTKTAAQLPETKDATQPQFQKLKSKGRSFSSEKCTWCGKLGHTEPICHAKRASKPKAMLSNAEEEDFIYDEYGDDDRQVVNSNTKAQDVPPAAMTIKVNSNKNISASSDATNNNGLIRETFFADTGANRTVHTNPKAAHKYHALQVKISTAEANKPMKSEGIGIMKLFSAKGMPIEGLDRVIFCKSVATKLLSVGELCDAGYTFVFNKECVSMYNSKELTIAAEPLVSDARDPKSQLYPITFYRKQNNATPICNMLKTATQEDLPEEITGDSIPMALLARSYTKPGLSDLDRYHAKFGDVGIKYMKRCLPDLKIPKEYRCDHCIEGKIHKFNHKKVSEGVRRDYLPGTCIHSDHSGPYAKTYSGARYSQLYLDRGSGYLWAYRQKQKIEHYKTTPLVITDAWGISGRKLQVFQTDGGHISIFISSNKNFT